MDFSVVFLECEGRKYQTLPVRPFTNNGRRHAHDQSHPAESLINPWKQELVAPQVAWMALYG
jgi:hypothetical protein